MKSSKRYCARQAVVQALYQWHFNPSEVRDLELEFQEEGYLEGAERAYFQEILRKAIADLEEIDAAITEAIRPWRIHELTGVERAILRGAVCELRDRHDVPFRVVINEAVELAKSFGTEHGFRFVNAVLDHIGHQLTRTTDPSEPSPHTNE